MRPGPAVLLAFSFLLPGFCSIPLRSQQTTADPAAAACGSTPANYNVKRDSAPFAVAPVPPGKAVIYVIESMVSIPFATSKVNIGLDGQWVGATDAQAHMSFSVDPGVHHLCAVYQGHIQSMDEEGQTLLLHLDAEAGHTYYLRYHALFLKDSAGLAMFEPVDEDEGLFLLQRTDASTSSRKK
jgi:hypothetical protein